MCDLRLTLERGEGADLTTPLHRRDRQASLARPFRFGKTGSSM